MGEHNKFEYHWSVEYRRRNSIGFSDNVLQVDTCIHIGDSDGADVNSNGDQTTATTTATILQTAAAVVA